MPSPAGFDTSLELLAEHLRDRALALVRARPVRPLRADTGGTPVAGHGGHPRNEAADGLAALARRCVAGDQDGDETSLTARAQDLATAFCTPGTTAPGPSDLLGVIASPSGMSRPGAGEVRRLGQDGSGKGNASGRGSRSRSRRWTWMRGPHGRLLVHAGAGRCADLGERGVLGQ